jgi:hypothetical protein
LKVSFTTFWASSVLALELPQAVTAAAGTTSAMERISGVRVLRRGSKSGSPSVYLYPPATMHVRESKDQQLTQNVGIEVNIQHQVEECGTCP